MGVEIYGSEGSPACRCVFLVARAIGLDYTLKPTNPMAGETRTEEFLRMNPAHTIPTMADDGLFLGESRAIATYLINKYAPESELYPREPAARAVVEQRLFYDVGLFAALRSVLGALLYFKSPEQFEAALPQVDECMELLETFLKRSPFVAGDHVTVADLAIVANVSTIEAAELDLSRWTRVQRWLAKMKALPYYSVNEAGAQYLGGVFKKALFQARKAKFSAS
ncbi:glutathione S-transferase 1-1-like [Amphibalanus amphitrite]|uniref:glutathione S-transferase 1-1-like n=1 Tax=Amphibalanus amphitrite TaxID=1232801 RepID=UPI001C905810|nr:glutathione S-transferase 1-1-like [Amphibalanus amphitrite]